MNLTFGNRVILLLGSLTSLGFFFAPSKQMGTDYLASLFQVQGVIGAATVTVLLVKSLLETYDERKFGPRQY